VYPSHWDVCIGGVLAAGETFPQGVKREIREELGIDADVAEMFPFPYEDAATVVRAMAYRVIHEGPFQLQAEEIVRGEFVPVDVVIERIKTDAFCPDGVRVLQEYLQSSQ
jgi:8-oxo-dGTP pyrophosphatase MutT (NUDIX family)